MIALTTGTWITVALLAPFWWGMGLLLVALLGDVSASGRVRIARLFNRLEGDRSPSAEPAASYPSRHAA